MAEIPENQVKITDLYQWYTMKAELAKLKTNEMLLRMRIFHWFFKSPKEGTNNHLLEDGFVLKAAHKISREVDEAAYTFLAPKFKDGFVDPETGEVTIAGFDPEKLIRRKPELVIGAYRELTAEQQAWFDQCLIVKDGAPDMKIEQPKKAVKVTK